MVHNNPGEVETESICNSPIYIKSKGDNGMGTQWYLNCAITYDNFENNVVPVNSKERIWIDKRATPIDKN